jgi:ANTAR domain
VPLSDLGVQAASVLSLRTANEELALHEFAALASAHVAGCTAASVALWGEGEVALQAASHPDATRLTQVQLDSGRGPLLEVLASRVPVQCADTLAEPRWPEYAAAAVRLGVRCSITLCAGDQQAVVLTLLGARPRAMDLSQLRVAELVTAFSAAVVGAVADYHESVRTNVQLQGAAEGRALVDQAKGILMHALSCSADEALARIMDVSQRSNLRATEVAMRVIESHAGLRGSAGPPPRSAGTHRR